MRKDMKLPARIEIDIVVTGPNPVTVVVGKCGVDREEPQHSIDIEDWSQCCFELFGRRGVQNFRQVDESSPRFGIILTLDLVVAFVSCRILSPVLETQTAVWPSRRFPAH